MEEAIHENNVYARNIENVVKHISEVESGRKGYYCMGCGREMQAKKGEKRAKHFAHDPKDVLNKGKCTYSDETYRHKLAKEILQRIKQIKVPPLYKYPPPGIEGRPYKLRDSEFISTESVQIELTFFEDEEGCIDYGKNINLQPSSDKFLLIKPDVTFFDESENPILLIEIVATHKITDEKLSRIKKLGINTIQITIPKDSPEEIENTFFKTTRTQWVYSYEQEQTTYIQPSKGDNEGIPPLDDFQRKLLEAVESYECRASQIRNLIRGLNKCLESQPYSDFKRHLGEEIQRVERNAEGHRERLHELQEGHERSIKEEFELEEGDVARQEEAVSAESRLLDEKRRELEDRYYRKKEELEREQKEYRSEFQPKIEQIEGEFERLGTSASNFGGRSIEIKREEAEFERFIRNEINRIEEDTRATADAIAEIEARRAALSEKYTGIETELRAEFERKAIAIERYGEQTVASDRDEFERNRRESVTAIETRDSKRVSRVQGRLRNIFETRNKLLTLRKRKITYTRLRKFRELFETGTYKSWA